MVIGGITGEFAGGTMVTGVITGEFAGLLDGY